jgi:hypothetical protein
MRVTLQIWRQLQRTSFSLRNVNCGPGHIQGNYSTAYSGHNIQLNVSATLLEIYRQLNVSYAATIVRNAAHILQFTLSGLWSRPQTLYLQLRIFRLQYSNERICAAIGDMSTIQRALYCKHGGKCSAGP